MRFCRLKALLLLLACVAACSESPKPQPAPSPPTQPQPMYPLPPHAADFRHDAMQPGVYEQDSFTLAEPYPAASALDHYRRQFSAWAECDYGGPTWAEIEDWTGGERRRVQQRFRAWISPTNGTFVLVALMYVHDLKDPAASPDDTPQRVVLVRRTTRDAAAELKDLGATCSSGT